MDNAIQLISIFAASMAVSFGAIGPALGEGRAVASAMDAIARQPDSAGTVSRTRSTLGVGSVSLRAVIAWTVGPAYGGSPASISYSTQPSE